MRVLTQTDMPLLPESGLCYKDEGADCCWWKVPASTVTAPSITGESHLESLPSDCPCDFLLFPHSSHLLNTLCQEPYRKGDPGPHSWPCPGLSGTYFCCYWSFLGHVTIVGTGLHTSRLGISCYGSLIVLQLDPSTMVSTSLKPLITMYSERPFPSFIQACPALMTSRALFVTPT